MRLTASLISLSMLLTPTVAFADGGFEVIVLGALGGIQEGNLSSFLIRPHGIATPLHVMRAVWSTA